jgi:hypothetical protein
MGCITRMAICKKPISPACWYICAFFSTKTIHLTQYIYIYIHKYYYCVDKSTEQNRFFFYYWHFALPGSLSTNCGGRVVDSIASKAFYSHSRSVECGCGELSILINYRSPISFVFFFEPKQECACMPAEFCRQSGWYSGRYMDWAGSDKAKLCV